jgi:hypothetical protein
MIAKNVQKMQFQERLKRISSGAPNTTRQVYAGTIAAPQSGKRAKNAKPVLRKPRTSRQSRVSLPVALLSGALIGAAAVLAVRYGRFRLDGGGLVGADADILMLVDLVLAMTLAIGLRSVIRIRSMAHGLGKVLGVAAMVVLMQNLVFAAPGLFERTFSVAWVDAVVGATQPNSVLLAGVTFTR